jgi:riboflavin synthase
VFTGIVEELGVVSSVQNQGDSTRLSIAAERVLSDVHPGDSIAVNGVCLTVIDPSTGEFSADVMQETLDRSSLGQLEVGTAVNLERAMRAEGRFGGHIVQGHVDGVATITAITPSEHWTVMNFSGSPELCRYLVIKGSITLDGVSLTLVQVGDDTFSVSLIPTTLRETTLGGKAAGEIVNVEVDVLAKYVEKMLGSSGGRH